MEIHVHIHHHHEGGALDKLLENQHLIISKIENFMANSQERFDALMARLDKVTTDIAGDYKTLLDEIKAGGVSEESLAKAEVNIATLEALGASVENPIPGEPPATETAA